MSDDIYMGKNEKTNLSKLKLWNSPYRNVAIEIAKRTMSIQAVYDYLESKNFHTSRKSIKRFITALTEENYLKESFNEIDKTLDVVKRHGDMLVELENSIKNYMILEAEAPPDEKGAFAKITNDRVRLITEMCLAHTKIKQEIGAIPSATKKIIEMKQTFSEQLTNARKHIIEKRSKIENG